MNTINPLSSANNAYQMAGMDKAPAHVSESKQSTADASDNASPQAPANSVEQLRSATELIKGFVQPVTSDITFNIDEDTGSTIVKVVDRETKDVIRQIPSEEIITIAKALDRLQGLLIRQKA